MHDKTIRFEGARSTLLLIDIQPDFMPGGALAVDEGERIIAPVSALLASGQFRHCVATQDWHPPGHISFASSHQGRRPFETIELYGHEQTLWPDHCVQGTEGARLSEGIPWEKVAVIVRKGMEPDCDSYSGFRNNWNPSGERPTTGLAGYLRERNIDTVFCCGLARDVCVQWTALDAAAMGFSTYFLWDLTRPVDSGSNDRVRHVLAENGVEVVNSTQLLRP